MTIQINNVIITPQRNVSMFAGGTVAIPHRRRPKKEEEEEKIVA